MTCPFFESIKNSFHRTTHFFSQTCTCVFSHFPKYWNQPCIYKRVRILEKRIDDLEKVCLGFQSSEEESNKKCCKKTQ